MYKIVHYIQPCCAGARLLRGRPPAALALSQADSLACFASLACNTGTSPLLSRAARAAVRVQ